MVKYLITTFFFMFAFLQNQFNKTSWLSIVFFGIGLSFLVIYLIQDYMGGRK